MATTHQRSLLQLPLGHIQTKAKGLGDALVMPFAVALQKQQHAGSGAIAEQSP
jgi:hypothetical protein